MPLSTIAGMLAGFGLFFVGVWTLTENLKSVSGRGLRRAVLKHTRHPVQGFLWGSLVGGVAQSLAGVVFILVGMISAGLLTMRAAIPVLAGANVGSSMLVFLSTIDLELTVLFVLGISGIALTQIHRPWVKPIMHGLFGLGLLFLGISFIQTNAAPIVDQPGVRSYLSESGGSLTLVFIVGVIFCVISQSVGAVTILAISLAVAGVLSFDQTILTIYGANVGSGIVTLMLSIGLRGSIRQIAILQIGLINFAGSFVLVGLWWVETHMGVPLVKALLTRLDDDLPGQFAYLYLILSAPIIPALFVLPWVEKVLARIAPPSRHETDSQPQFIHRVDPSDTESALAAAEADQNRLASFLRVFFEIAEGTETEHTAGSLNASARTLATELDYYLDDLAAAPLLPEEFERLSRILYRQRVLRSLTELCAETSVQLDLRDPSPGMERFLSLLRTALETVLDTALSAGVDRNARDLDRLAYMVGDRSEILGEIRYAYVTRHAVNESTERMTMVRLTVLAERIFWALDMLRKTLDGQGAMSGDGTKRLPEFRSIGCSVAAG